MNLLDLVPPQSRAQWIRDAIGIAVLFGVGLVAMVAIILSVPS